MNRQRGTIRRRGATFTAYWRVCQPDGTWKQRTKGGFSTQGAAQEHLNRMLVSVGDGTYSESPAKKITVGQFLDTVWLPSIRNDGKRRPSTIESYEVAVRAWLKPEIGGELLAGLSPARVEMAYQALREHGGKGGRPLGDRSVQYAALVLTMAFDRAVRLGYVTRNVSSIAGRPGARVREMTAWTAEQAQAFLAAAADDPWYAGWLLLLARGLRRGELAGLRWEPHIDLEVGRLSIVQTRISVSGREHLSTPKTAKGRRSIPLDPGLVAALRAHRARQIEDRLAWGAAWTDSGYVLTREDGTPPHPELISGRFDALVRRAGVPRIRLHDCRHTAVTLMLADGTPVSVVSEMVGHSSPTVTLGVYSHVLPGASEAAGARLSAALGVPS